MAEAPSFEQSLRIVRKVATFNGGHIADDLERVEQFLLELRSDINRIYELIPALPVTDGTAEAATDAFIAFCNAFTSMIDIAAAENAQGES